MTEKEHNKDDHVVFIGSKPFMKGFQWKLYPKIYVTGVVMQFTTQGADEVVVKGRGKFITRCVDVSEVVSKRFLEGQITVKDVRLDSEEFENKEGKRIRVSTIEITLKKKQS